MKSICDLIARWMGVLVLLSAIASMVFSEVLLPIDMKIINPTDVDKILIQEGRDLLTLLTCHPYGTGGRYRLVVYCERNYD